MFRILWAMMLADAVLAIPISPKQTASVEGERFRPGDESVKSVFGGLVELVWCHCGTDAEVGGAGGDAAVDEVWMVDGFAFDAGVDDFEGMSRDLAMTFAAAPPERRFRTICRVTSLGYAETFCAAMPWSAPKMMSWQVDMLGVSVPWRVAIWAASCSRRPREPMGLVLESRARWMSAGSMVRS